MKWFGCCSTLLIRVAEFHSLNYIVLISKAVVVYSIDDEMFYHYDSSHFLRTLNNDHNIIRSNEEYTIYII